MRYKIIEIREDAEGDLWFLAEGYSQGEDWWLHLSDEYSHDHPRGRLADKRYKLTEV